MGASRPPRPDGRRPGNCGPFSRSVWGSAGNGNVGDHGDGTYTCMPNAGSSRNDSFTYTVDDGNGYKARPVNLRASDLAGEVRMHTQRQPARLGDKREIVPDPSGVAPRLALAR